jgi:HAMP domain-containing protein
VPSFRIGPRGLRTKFLAVAVGTVLLLGVSTMVFVRAALERSLVDQLSSRGLAIARHVAASAVDPLLTERFLDLELMLRETLRDEQDVEYLFVLSPRSEILAHTFAGGFPVALKVRAESRAGVRHLETGFGRVLDVSTPLLGGSLGVLHLGLSEHALRRQVLSTVRAIGWIVAGCTLAAALLAVLLDMRIAAPLGRLAAAADEVRDGMFPAALPADTDDEVGRLAAAFNAMVAGKRSADAEQQRLIQELQAALASVHQLQGLLPICSGCKMIRDDQGYWKQIESYLGTHADVRFSHGLCPECLKKLYPEYAALAETPRPAPPAGTAPPGAPAGQP